MTKDLSRLTAQFFLAEAEAVGLTVRDLGDLVDQGEVFQREPGDRYFKTGDRETLWLDIWDATSGLPGSVACLESALAWHGFADAVPKRVQIAVPRGTTREGRFRLPVVVFEYDPRTFDIGARWHEVNRGCDAMIYDRYRTLVDAVVHRDRIGEDVVREAVRRYKANPALRHESDKRDLTRTALVLDVERQVSEFFASTP
ncbi:type IV toxin-antitoxin system AbiEi family antitoxin domain-containing protein [Allokutzneria albata]|uniref:Transcriptional regulator, AbiEi antitoxin, Type IV TA system n=1 Tax=Allokutzneria albata TaxID=211114 RepID=A0A1G9TNA8_ALLAB|nr:hypothetical protein [Allokutzneria albata]SDM49141.1 Transcriptional regulator, AbiEi antitoxin, Type IV TA system [Allokutzneria albata]